MVARSSLGAALDQAPDEVEPHAADARLVELAQLGVGDVRPDGRDAACPAAGRPHGVDHRAVVRAVAGGLDDDVAADPEVVAQREQLLLAGVARGVLALRREGELVARPEDVAVRVDRADREREGRGRGLRYQSSHPGVVTNVELIRPPRRVCPAVPGDATSPTVVVARYKPKLLTLCRDAPRHGCRCACRVRSRSRPARTASRGRRGPTTTISRRRHPSTVQLKGEHHRRASTHGQRNGAATATIERSIRRRDPQAAAEER